MSARRIRIALLITLELNLCLRDCRNRFESRSQIRMGQVISLLRMFATHVILACLSGAIRSSDLTIRVDCIALRLLFDGKEILLGLGVSLTEICHLDKGPEFVRTRFFQTFRHVSVFT